MSEVNKSFIGVVRETADGQISYDKVAICPRHLEFIEELKDMVDNPNRTVLDLQNHFDIQFNFAPNYYNYCSCYSDSYVGAIGKPKHYSFAEYQELMREVETKGVSIVSFDIEAEKRNKATEVKRTFVRESIEYVSTAIQI